MELLVSISADCLRLVEWAKNKKDLARGLWRLNQKYPGRGFDIAAEDVQLGLEGNLSPQMSKAINDAKIIFTQNTMQLYSMLGQH